jgi:hypothetical protein
MSTPQSLPPPTQDERIEFKRLGYSLVLMIAGDGLSCSAAYTPSGNGAPLTLTEFQTFMTQAKIREGIIQDGVEALLASAAQGTPVTCVIAAGLAMVPGTDGTIRFAVRDALDNENNQEDTTEPAGDGRMDLRRVQRFLNVESGQLVGTILQPGEGTAGKNVRGQPIPAQPGTALDVELVRNIRLGDDGVSLYAEADGRLCWQGKELSVEDIYLIKGDIDFKVGNVLYNGYLDVKGDILDGFKVQASKGIKVQGNIGACEISSGGTISFCGLNGQGKATITCGGTVIANFIHDAQVEAEGDVLVETEARNCFIRSNGMIKVNKGVLAGGESVALGGIESSIIGTISSLRTRLIAGVSHQDLTELNRLFNELKELVARFNAPGKPMDAKEFGRIRAEITAKIQAVRERNHPAQNAKVNCKKRLHEGVSLTIGQTSEDVREGRDGPFSIIENSLEGGLRYLGLTDLTVKAEEIEEAFRQQQLLLQKSGSEVQKS